jgi:hypothetical protein
MEQLQEVLFPVARDRGNADDDDARAASPAQSRRRSSGLLRKLRAGDFAITCFHAAVLVVGSKPASRNNRNATRPTRWRDVELRCPRPQPLCTQVVLDGHHYL